MARKVIGIDFGSSQSSIAIMDIGSTSVPELLNVGGGRGGVTIPTLLALDPNDDSVIAYGNDARKLKLKLKLNREEEGNVIFPDNFKRYLGISSITDKYCKLFLKELANFVKKHFNVDKLDPQDYVTSLAYPATWTTEQINALKQYAQEAGFPVDPETGIYSTAEPVSAMHALKVQSSENFCFGNKPEHYMVIDFGGGTLDICIIKTDILGRTPKIVSTSGDPLLGGKEFDEIIEHLFFRNNESIKKSDLSLREQAELSDKFKEAKEAFSENFLQNDIATHPFHISRGQYTLTISKQEFLNICNDRKIFEKIKNSIRVALVRAHIDVPTIKKVILTGGSSKWFFLREIVAQEFSLGGDSIFLTENPFTDVAKGCAIAIGRPDAPPKKKGVWIKFKVDNDTEWSNAKCILRPARNTSTGGEKMFIGTVTGTQYVQPYKITFSWWTGFEEDKLEKTEEEAIIEFYARSNVPFMDTMRGVYRAIRHVEYKPMPDEYKIYLQYQENETGGIYYHFEIMDATASHKESRRLCEGEEAAEMLPDGMREIGDIIPGYISSRSLGGLTARKLIPLKMGK